MIKVGDRVKLTVKTIAGNRPVGIVTHIMGDVLTIISDSHLRTDAMRWQVRRL